MEVLCNSITFILKFTTFLGFCSNFSPKAKKTMRKECSDHVTGDCVNEINESFFVGSVKFMV